MNKNQGVSVSVVIPTFGRAPSLANTINALTGQTHRPAEIIVVDQNPAGTLEAALGDSLKPVKLLSQTTPNASTARNFGFAKSMGDIILFMDDDLVPDADYIEQALIRFSNDSSIGCLCPCVVTSHSPAAREEFLASLSKRIIVAHPKLNGLLAITDTMSASMFFRRDVYQQSGGFDELLFEYAKTAEDKELCLRMGHRNLTIWLDSELSIYHDEEVEGGCELRTKPYWHTRKKIIRSMVLLERLHGEGKIGASGSIRLLRSAFLNRDILRRPPTWGLRNARLLGEAVWDSASFLSSHVPGKIPNTLDSDFVSRHL